MNFLNSLRISRKLLAAFAILVVIAASVGTITFVQVKRVQAISEDSAHLDRVVSLFGDLEQAAFGQLLSVRGLLLTGDRGNIRDFEQYGAALEKAYGQLGNAVTNPAIRSGLTQLRSIVDDWQNNVAKRQIELMRAPLTVDEARVMEANGAGEAFARALSANLEEIFGIGLPMRRSNGMPR